MRPINLSQAGDYAIAALARLALEQEAQPGPVPTRVIAKAQGIPGPFLSKILSMCAKAGLVRSYKGAQGGVELARAPERISLLDIIEACEGRYGRERCVFHTGRACPGKACPLLCPLRDEEEELRTRLAGLTLLSMARKLEQHHGPDPIPLPGGHR